MQPCNQPTNHRDSFRQKRKKNRRGTPSFWSVFPDGRWGWVGLGGRWHPSTPPFPRYCATTKMSSCGRYNTARKKLTFFGKARVAIKEYSIMFRGEKVGSSDLFKYRYLLLFTGKSTFLCTGHLSSHTSFPLLLFEVEERADCLAIYLFRDATPRFPNEVLRSRKCEKKGERILFPRIREKGAIKSR